MSVGDTPHLVQRGPSRTIGGCNVILVAFLVALPFRLMRTFGKVSDFVCGQLDWRLVNQPIRGNLMRSTTNLRICATYYEDMLQRKKRFRKVSSPGKVGGYERMMTMMKTESLPQLVDGLKRQSRGIKTTSQLFVFRLICGYGGW